MRRFITLVTLAILSSVTTGVAGTIYWVGTTGNYSDGANWNTQSNGSGTSGAPTNTDDIVIDRNATITIDGTYFPSSLWIINNAVVNFTNPATSKTYTIGGSLSVSPQFKVEAGSTLNIQGTASIVIEVLAGSLAQIYGTIDITGSSSRMNYLGGTTQVMNGGKLRYGPGSSNGTGSRATFFMLGGSTYEVYKNGGSFPTGTYDEGSLILNTGAVANPALFNMNSSVGSYGSYEFNSPGYTNTTNGFNQNISVSNFKLTDDGSGKWVFSTSNSTSYTLTVNGDLTQDANTTIDINRAASGSQATVLLLKGSLYTQGNITESGNNTGSEIQMNASFPVNLNLGTDPNALTNDVSLRINAAADILGGVIYMPNSPNAKLYLDNGNLDVLTNTGAMIIQSPLPGAIVGGSVASHIIGRMIRASNQSAAYEFPVSNNATQLAKAVITPNNANATNWDVSFKTPNPNAGSGLTPGSIEMVTPYYWTIDAIGAPAAGASNLTLHYSDLTSSTVVIPAQLKMVTWNGSSWVSLGGLDNGGNLTNTLGSTGGAAPGDPVTNFAIFRPYALGGILGTLPISIEYFTGMKNGKDHNLAWKVNCTNSPGVTMTLERSSDSRSFRGIKTINADAIRCREPFNHTDSEPLGGLNYYRVKIVDADGQVSYSKIIGLLNRQTGFEVVGIAPNPANQQQESILSISSTKPGSITVLITDMNGRRISSRVFPMIAGNNQLKLETTQLPSGQYTVTILGDDGETISRTVLKL
jgi:hypothetical protein